MRNIDKKYHYLYKTTNLINNKYYYGIHSTNNIDDGYLGSGTHLRHSIRKYGKMNFVKEILSYYNTREELLNAEKEIITEDLIRNRYCMNLSFGGICGSINMVTVKDKKGNTFNVFTDDPRYLSGELLFINSGKVAVKDKDGNSFQVDKYDPRYLSGELISTSTGLATVKDKDGNIIKVAIDDPRYLSGELISIAKNTITVKDKEGNMLKVAIDDPRYLSGELVGATKGYKPTKESNSKRSNSMMGKLTKEKNPSYGTCWITNNIENKKIKKEELDQYLNKGWTKGTIKTYFVNDGNIIKKVKINELQTYLDNGWKRGIKK